MKKVILILGILTTVMVYGVVAGPSDNAAPDIDMELLEEEDCRVCHDSASYLRNTNHYEQHNEIDSCSGLKCHNPTGSKKLDCIKSGCHNPVIDHHEFVTIFSDNDDWDCFTCHEKGVPRPLDK